MPTPSRPGGRASSDRPWAATTSYRVSHPWDLFSGTSSRISSSPRCTPSPPAGACGPANSSASCPPFRGSHVRTFFPADRFIRHRRILRHSGGGLRLQAGSQPLSRPRDPGGRPRGPEPPGRLPLGADPRLGQGSPDREPDVQCPRGNDCRKAKLPGCLPEETLPDPGGRLL